MIKTRNLKKNTPYKLLNRKVNRFSLSLLLLSSTMACSSTYSLKTLPDDAKIIASGKLIGKSPLAFSSSQLPDKAKKAGGYLLRIERPNYKPIHLWIPDEGRNYELNVNLLPFYQKDKNNEQIESQKEFSVDELNQLTDNALYIQDNLINGDAIDAKTLQQIFAANPNLGSAHFLKALEALRANNKTRARDFLNDAIRFAPLEKDFLSLRNEIGNSK